MLAFFRNNHSTTAFILAVYIALLRLPAILGWVAPPEAATDDGGLLYMDLLGHLHDNPFFSAVLATALVYIQALAINWLTDHYRILDNRNWYPGALYGFAASCIPDFLFLSPTLVAVTFIPFALWSIFGVYKQTLVLSAAFNSAFWITVATLFYPPAVWLLPVAYLGLLNLRALSIQKQLVFFTGIIVPVFLTFTAYFWNDQAIAFLQIQFTRWLHSPAFQYSWDFYNTLKILFLSALLLVSILGFNVYYFHKLIQVKKYISILYWVILVSLATTLTHPEIRLEHALPAMPAVGIFLSLLGQSVRNTALADLLHLGLLLILFYIQFCPNIS
ncbi:MAG: hypothetical protein R3D58_22790 [Saprospiraceae bacterium]